MTNGEKLRSMTDEELADALDRMTNDEREDWHPIGCHSCMNADTHHCSKSDRWDGKEVCEDADGIIGWLRRESD